MHQTQADLTEELKKVKDKFAKRVAQRVKALQDELAKELAVDIAQKIIEQNESNLADSAAEAIGAEALPQFVILDASHYYEIDSFILVASPGERMNTINKIANGFINNEITKVSRAADPSGDDDGYNRWRDFPEWLFTQQEFATLVNGGGFSPAEELARRKK